MTDAESESTPVPPGPDEPGTDGDATGVDAGEAADHEPTDHEPTEHEPADAEDDDVVVSGVDDIADLIEEATSAATPALDATDEAQEDHSAEVWGDDGAEGGVDAVWADVEEASAGHSVWGEHDTADDDVWDEQDRQHLPPPAANPTQSTAPVEQWTVPSAEAADGDEEPDADVWIFDVTAETQQDDRPEAPLAESATPREDAGWHDLDAEGEPGWSVPDLPLRRPEDDEEEPAGFAASVDDTDDATDDDAPWTSGPAADEDDQDDDGAVDLPADVVTAEVHDALGELLGNGDDAEERRAPAPGGDTPPAPPASGEAEAGADPAPAPPEDDQDPFDELDLDQFDDLEAPTEAPPPAPPPQPPPQPPTDQGAEHDQDAEHDQEDGELDAPTAARQVMEPGGVSFSSGGKKKKRGLFG